MKMGFTGTRVGMTLDQEEDLERMLNRYMPTEFHHGDCTGADEDAHEIVLCRVDLLLIVIHPPNNPKHRAWCVGGKVLKEKRYLDRNHDIVDACDLLIACPRGPERVRSGTWATVRHARRTNKRVIVLYPKGGSS